MVKILSALKKSVKWVFIGLILFFIYAPILFLTVYSFNESDTIGIWNGFSLTHYEYFFNPENEPIRVVGQTILLAFVVALLSTVLGTVGSIGIFYSSAQRCPPSIGCPSSTRTWLRQFPLRCWWLSSESISRPISLWCWVKCCFAPLSSFYRLSRS